MTHKSSDTLTSKGSFMRNVFLLVNVSTVSHPELKAPLLSIVLYISSQLKCNDARVY